MRGEEQIFDELLREGGCSAIDFSGFRRDFRDFLHLLPIDAVMLVETAILGGNYSVLQVGRNPPERHEGVSLMVASVMKPSFETPLHLDAGGGRVDKAQGEEREDPKQIEAGEGYGRGPSQQAEKAAGCGAPPGSLRQAFFHESSSPDFVAVSLKGRS